MPTGHDKKVGNSLLQPIERLFIDWIVPKIPQWISSKELTLLTIVWSVFILGGSYLAQYTIEWLWFVSLNIFLQWFTDSIDGSLGKYRQSGLVLWGFYMDHFLDYLFLCAILIGYSFLIPPEGHMWLFLILAICGGFMVNSFLAFGSTNKFKIQFLGIGPTEIRLLFIAINTLIILFGKTHLAFLLPWVLIACMIGLWIVVYSTQKTIYELDMKNK